MQPRWSVWLEPSRELCGTTLDEFGRLLTALAPLAEADKRARENYPGRQRAPGAGAKPKPFWFRTMVALTHAWTGLTLRPTGRIFGIDERTVRTYRDELQRLLVAHGVVVPGRTIRDATDLAAHLHDLNERGEEFVVIDGTEVRRTRPQGWDQQRPAWSNKTHQHAAKATVVSDPDGNPLWWEANPSGEGRTHDIAMLRAQGALLAALMVSGIAVLGDLGYEGLHHDLGDRAWAPKRRRPGRTRLDRDDTIYNHALAQSRIRVEHSIRYLKRWRTLTHWRRTPDQLDNTGKAIVALCSILRAN